MRPHELCRRCGSLLDPALIAQDWDRHPNCYHHTPADDLAHARALRAVAAAFPTARRITERQAS